MEKNTVDRHCLCGCGEKVVKSFKPGHDGRYLGRLLDAARLGVLTRAEAEQRASEVSNAFAAKLAPYLDQLDEQRATLRANLARDEAGGQ